MIKNSITKICTKCKTAKPLTEFSVNNRKKDALKCWCKACDHRSYLENKDNIRKRCIDYYEKNKTNILNQCKQYYRRHKDEIKEYQVKYNNANKEKVAARKKAYNEINKDKLAIKRRQNYHSKRGKILHKIRTQKYDQTLKGKIVNKKKACKRRALKVGVGYENFNPIEIFERDGYRCQLCGRKTRPNYNRWHSLFPNLDHIIPLMKDGAHTKANTQCLCRECNIKKGHTGIGDQLRMFG